MREDSISKWRGPDLLNQFEFILESDPLLNEVGFIHPSQFDTLNKEAEIRARQSQDGILSSEVARDNDSDNENANFWNRDHKLGISTHVLLQLCEAAKDAFMDAIGQYRKIENVSDRSTYFSYLEYEVTKHSKAVLMLSCDFGTAWNFRKLILSKKQHITILADELLLSEHVLSYSPKSEQAWCHRWWAIKRISGKCSDMQEIVGKESEIVEKIAERSKMNYWAWNHRCWLVSCMAIEHVIFKIIQIVLLELKKSRNWAGLHGADNSCFHYRTRLMLKILEEPCQKQDESSCNRIEIYQIWQEELHWNKELIKHYVGRDVSLAPKALLFLF